MPEPSPALPRGLSQETRLYLEPAGLLSGAGAEAALASGRGWPLLGGPLVFTGLLVYWRGGATYADPAALMAWADVRGRGEEIGTALARLSAPRSPWAGFVLDRPLVMGVINVTPDSFSDGGLFLDPQAAIAHGRALLSEGADIIDVGGESTRPGAAAVGADEECARVLPVIGALARAGAKVSIDSRHAAVIGAALEAGAAIINDVTALTGDPGSLAIAARSGKPVVLMHMQGDPASMQKAPAYDCAPLDLYDYFERRIAACEAAGIGRERLCLDPGIGFGKTDRHNCQILAHLALYHGLAVPLMLGVSRKSFIGRLSAGEGPDDRLAGSLAVALSGIGQGVGIVRVHDVAETVQAIRLWQKTRE